MPEVVVETQIPRPSAPPPAGAPGAELARPPLAGVSGPDPKTPLPIIPAMPEIQLSPAEKALLVLVSLDEDVATRMVASLDDRELALLKRTIAKMHEVPPAAIVVAQREFVERLRAGVPASLAGSEGYLKRLVGSAHGQQRARALWEGAKETPEERVSPFTRFPPKTLAGLIEREHPQTAALILSQLDGAKGSEVLLGLSAELRREVVQRLGYLESVPASALAEVEAEYERHLARLEGGQRKPIKGKDVAATILKRVSQDESSSILDALGEADSTMADSLRQALFTFEDLRRLDTRSMQQVLKEVPTDQLLLALKTASEALRQRVFSSLSQRAADMLREDLALLGPTRLSEVEAAQRAMVEAALTLERDGRISIVRDGGADFV
jgi:flagellar motor switch protein FliG